MVNLATGDFAWSVALGVSQDRQVILRERSEVRPAIDDGRVGQTGNLRARQAEDLGLPSDGHLLAAT